MTAASINRNDMLTALRTAVGIRKTQTVYPVLSHCKIDLLDGKARITATDLDLEYVSHIDAEIDAPGSFTISAETASAALSKVIGGADVYFEPGQSEGHMRLTAGRAVFELPTFDPAIYPPIASDVYDTTFDISGADLTRLLKRTSWAAAKDETKYLLCGVYFHVNSSGLLTGVATNAHKMGQADTVVPSGADGMPGVIIPTRTIGEILRVIEEQDAVEVSVSQTKIRIKAGAAQLVSKVVDATYPAYETVIPTGNDIVLTADTSELKQAIDRVLVVTSDKVRTVILSLDTDMISLSAGDGASGTGAASDEVICAYAGPAHKIGINARYLQEALATITSESVELRLAGNGQTPVIVRDTGDDRRFSLIMPTRI